jgi:hypothetical protein
MNDRSPSLTVRVKLVNLNHSGCPALTSPPRSASASVPALVGSGAERSSRLHTADVGPNVPLEKPSGEICLHTGECVPYHEFESHIETCKVCSNRVELQLDFIETLEASMYQRQAERNSPKMRGALLISSPKLNFAICGEVDI